MATTRGPRPRLRLGDLDVLVGDEYSSMLADGALAVGAPAADADGARSLDVVVEARRPGAPDHRTELRLGAEEVRALRDALDAALADL